MKIFKTKNKSLWIYRNKVFGIWDLTVYRSPINDKPYAFEAYLGRIRITFYF